MKDDPKLFEVTNGLAEFYEREAVKIAERIAGLIRKYVPEHLLQDYIYFNSLANMPILDTLVEALIEKGILTPPEGGLGAEGCWMTVEKWGN